ncbi:MAG TPA: beta-phosphoglucomutase [Clostridium sp.]
MSIKAVIFDLDGVIVSTDKYHYQAWKKMADEEGIYFDKLINEGLRGVSRMESLEILLRKSQKTYKQNEKDELAQRKNHYYRELLNCLTTKDILPGVSKVLEFLKERGIKIAIGSSSKNTPFILEKIGLESYFHAVSDGNDIKRSKPDPEVFLLAAKKLQVIPEECLVIEDADSGIEAALAGGMKAMGMGSAANNEKADYRVKDLTNFNFEEVLK